MNRKIVVVYRGQCYIGTVVGGGVRVQYDPFLQDTVLKPGEYEFKRWEDTDE